MNLEVLHFGIGTVHGEDFIYSRPGGVGGAWVFMHLPVPLEIDTAGGRVRSAAGDCILHDPRFPQMHRALPGGFHNDWMHFRGADVTALMREYRLRVNTLLQLPSTDFLRVAMREIEWELAEQPLHWRRRVAGLTADLLLRVSRQSLDPVERKVTRAESAHLERLRGLRLRVRGDLERVWTVAEMAAAAHLSEPRFSALYRRFFEVSPNEDLIRARIEHAKFLLAHTSIPVRTVAAKCGFDSVHYFSRAFRRRVGCSPGQYLRRPLPSASQDG